MGSKCVTTETHLDAVNSMHIHPSVCVCVYMCVCLCLCCTPFDNIFIRMLNQSMRVDRVVVMVVVVVGVGVGVGIQVTMVLSLNT